MSHLERLREFTFISASGKYYQPLWDDLERTGGKKASVHELPGSDLSAVQDNGNKAQSWPVELYIVGPNYDQPADAFYNALHERGRAKIKHPRWGDIPVLAVDVKQSESFVDGIRSARFSVTFIHFPELTASLGTTSAAAIQSGVDAAATASAAANSAGMVSSLATDIAKMKSKVTRAIKDKTRKLKSIAGAVDSVRSAVEATGALISSSIDTLAATPLALAQSTLALVRAPARIESSIKDKVTGYADLIVDSLAGIVDAEGASAYVMANDLLGLSLASIEAVTAGTMSSRGEAVTAHDTLIASVSSVEHAIDTLQAQGYAPDPALLALLANLKAQASTYLLESAYSLPSERRKVLDAESTPLEEAWALYGDADEAARLIAENGWGGDMILVLPIGTEVRYYA